MKHTTLYKYFYSIMPITFILFIFFTISISHPFICTLLNETTTSKAPECNIKLLAILWEKASIDYLTGAITLGAAAFAYIQWQEEKDRSAKELASGLSAHWVTDWSTISSPIQEDERKYKNTEDIRKQRWGIYIINSTNTEFTNVTIYFKFHAKHFLKALKYEHINKKVMYTNPYRGIGSACKTHTEIVSHNLVNPISLYKDDMVIDHLTLKFLPPGKYLIRLTIEPWPRKHQCDLLVIGFDFTEPIDNQLPPLTRANEYTITHIHYRDYKGTGWLQRKEGEISKSQPALSKLEKFSGDDIPTVSHDCSKVFQIINSERHPN